MHPFLRSALLLILLNTLVVGATNVESRKDRPHQDSPSIVRNAHTVGKDGVPGPGAHWSDPVVEARFYGSDALYAVHEVVWAAIAAAVPAGGTRFVSVHTGQSADCPAKPQMARPYILICIVPDMAEVQGAAGMTGYATTAEGVMLWADENMDDGYAELSEIQCHEAMHAVTGIWDNTDPAGIEPSCVHGHESMPGSFDIAFIQQVYGGAPVTPTPVVTPAPTPAPTPVPTVTPPVLGHPNCDKPGWAARHAKQCPLATKRGR